MTEPSAEARGQAARIWCEPQHSHKVLDTDLCESFARALAEKDMELAAARRQYDDEAWMHAACLSIAEGVQGWEECLEGSLAIIAVKKLRRERDDLQRRVELRSDKPADAARSIPKILQREVTDECHPETA